MSDCDLCIGGCLDYDDYWDFYSIRYPKARKEYRCRECHDTIPPKTKYESYSYKFDGTVKTERTCMACADIRDVYSCGEDPPPFGELWEYFDLSDGFYKLKMAGECWEKLGASSKAKLLEMWAKWKGLQKNAV